MQLNRLLLLTSFLALAIPGFAQTLRGVVKDGESRKPLAAVTIANLRTAQFAYTDANGAFTINAQKGDQISFTAMGYKAQEKTVPSALGVAEMQVDLFHLSYELEDFVYRPKYSPYQIDSIERKSTYQRALAREKSGSIMSPVTLLAEKLSKNSKQIFRFQKSFSYWEDQKFIESRYSPRLVQQLTGLTGDTLAYFINLYPIPYDYARVASELELKLFIKDNYKAWLAHPVYPPAAIQSPASPADSLKSEKR